MNKKQKSLLNKEAFFMSLETIYLCLDQMLQGIQQHA